MPRVFPLLVLLALTAICRAEPPSAEQIQQWILDLDDSSYRVRDQAAKQLRLSGAEVAAALAKAAKTGSAETSDRTMRILGEMADGDDAKAEAAARRQLRRLADGESKVAGEAKSLLNRKRNRLLATLLLSGASYDDNVGGVTDITLDRVADLESVLPMLKYFPELEYLSISNRQFTDAGAAHLKDLPNLRDLNLFESNIGDEGLKQLTGLKNLRRIPMGHTRVTDKGLKIISGMTQLEYIGVRGDDVTDEGLAHLKGLTNLTGLCLGETKVTDDGLKHLAPLTKLDSLYLYKTGITDAGLEHLNELKNLLYLYLKNTKTTAKGRARLKDAIPGVRITDLSDE
jgi:hypothetical protein